MAAMPLEMIQARSLTSRLRTASFLVDREGTLVYFNDAAADLLGISFEEAGRMEAGTWGTRFAPREPGGRELIVGAPGRAGGHPVRAAVPRAVRHRQRGAPGT